MDNGELLSEKLGNIVDIIMGQSPDSEHYNSESWGLPLIQGNADLRNRKSIKRIWTSQITKTCETGDIIITVRAPVGKIGIASYDSCVGRGVCSLKAKKVDADYLYHLLIFYENKWNTVEQGSTFSAVGSTEIINFPLSIINSLKEQTRIAAILSKADQAISQTEQLIAKYQRIKTGLMQDLLTKGIDDQGNIRSEKTHRFKTENGLRVPEEWICSFIDQFLETIEQGWSPDCESDTASSGEWGVLKTTSVTWEGYNQNENKRLPDKLSPKLHYEIKAGDVLITRGGPNSRVGVVAYVIKTRSKLILCDKIYRLKPKIELLPEFLALALSSPITQKHLSNLKTGMAESQTNISQKIVKSLNLLVPKLHEQKKIIERVNMVDKLLNDYKSNLNKLHSLKTGLMQDLLTGRVRVKVGDE